MSGFFNMENGFFSTISKIVDIIILSMIWSLLCLPIITIGPATTALYYTVVKVIRRERGYLMREYFSAFKSNFKIGTLSTIVLLIMYLILIFDQKWANTLEGTMAYILISVFNSMIFLLTCVAIYLFPILSRFKISMKQLFKTSLFMSMKHLPSTILIAIIIAVFGLGTYIIMPLVFIAPALCCLVVSFLFERVLKKYMPQKDEEDENSRDEWYLE